MLDQGGRNIILDQTEFININTLTSDSEFNVLAQAFRDDSNNF